MTAAQITEGYSHKSGRPAAKSRAELTGVSTPFNSSFHLTTQIITSPGEVICLDLWFQVTLRYHGTATIGDI